MNSDPGDYIGAGQQYFFTPTNGTFTGQQNLSNHVSISFNSAQHFWFLDFAALQNQRLMVGTYPGATRYPFQQPTEPGLDVAGDGRGCNMLTGSFEVKQVVYGSANQLTAFWATFEQHCEGAAPALFGEIRFNAAVPVVVSAPVSVLGVEGGTLSFVVSAMEIQNRHVTLTASNAPAGASFVDHGNNSGTFTWMPGSGQAGVYTVTFHGDNGLGARDDAPTRILVTIPGDDFGTAIPITRIPYTNILDTTAATMANDDPFSCSFPSRTVWYVLTPTNRVRLQASTAGSDYDTVLSVFTGSRGALTQVVCNDNSGGLASEVVFDALAGRAYYFMVGASGGGAGGTLVFSVNELVPPPNDDFPNAIPIAAVPYTNVLDTTGAIAASDDPGSCVFPAHTVWYTFTPTTVQRIEASTLGSDYEAVIAVYTGTRGALSLVACGSKAGGQGSQVAFNTVAGRRYYFMIGSRSGPGGILMLSVNAILPPPNDDFDQATVIPALPYTNFVNTSLATTNLDDPDSCNYPGASVWYSFTPTQDLFVNASAAGSDYSVVLTPYTGSRGALEQVTCFGGNQVQFPALAGRQYYLLAGSFFHGPGGHLALTVRGRPKLKIGVSVDSIGAVDSQIGAATIQGTVTSSQPVIINLNGLLRQKVGRTHIITGEFGQSPYGESPPPPPPNPPVVLIRCSGQTPWSVRIFSEDGAFGGGHAFVLVSAFAELEGDSSMTETSSTIRLNGSVHLGLDAQQPQLLSVERSAGGTVLLQSLSVMGRTNILQVSTNLRDWTPMSTNVPTSNPFDWLDVEPDYPQRFYRLLTLP